MGACTSLCCPDSSRKEGNGTTRLPEFEDDDDLSADLRKENGVVSLPPDARGYGQYEKIETDDPDNGGWDSRQGRSSSNSRKRANSFGRTLSNGSVGPSRTETPPRRRKSASGRQVQLPNGESVEAKYFARFLDSEGGDKAKATKRCVETLAWRRLEEADRVLFEPLPQFWRLKSFVPHCYHGTDREGRVVLYQRPGLMQLPLLAKHGLNTQQLPEGMGGSPFVKQYIYQEEFLMKHMSRSDSDSVIKVIDLSGLKRSALTPELRSMMKASMKLGKYYPGRTHRMIIVNKPVWASVVLALFSSMLSAAEQKKMVSFTPSATLKGLEKFIPLENIPKEFGGQSRHPMGCAPEEVALYAHVRSLAPRADSIQPVKPQHFEAATGFLPPSPVGFWGADKSGQKAARAKAELAGSDPSQSFQKLSQVFAAAAASSSAASSPSASSSSPSSATRSDESVDQSPRGDGGGPQRGEQIANGSDGLLSASTPHSSAPETPTGASSSRGGGDGDSGGEEEEEEEVDSAPPSQGLKTRASSRLFSTSGTKKSSFSYPRLPKSPSSMFSFSTAASKAKKEGANKQDERTLLRHDEGKEGEEEEGEGSGSIAGRMGGGRLLDDSGGGPFVSEAGERNDQGQGAAASHRPGAPAQHARGGGSNSSGGGGYEGQREQGGEEEEGDEEATVELSVTSLDNDLTTIFYCDRCTFKGTFETVQAHEKSAHGSGRLAAAASSSSSASRDRSRGRS